MARVLIIDDDEDVTRLLQAHLTEEGHGVIVAHDAKEGMAQLLKMAPDLIMLDVFLPDATGYQMCNRIRKNESTKTTPIIMMTGAARFPNQQMYGRQRGANEYIFKPFNIVEVGELVQKYIIPDNGNNIPSNGNGNSHAETTNGQPVVPQEFMDGLGAFLKKQKARPIDATVSEEPAEPLAAFGAIVLEPLPTIEKISEPPVIQMPVQKAPEPRPVAPPIAVSAAVPMEPLVMPPIPQNGYIPPSLGSKERFQDFGLEVYALASRLCSSHAEKYLADQLLRTSLSMASKLHVAPFAVSPAEFMGLTSAALRDLREAGYWLVLTRRLGLLDKLAKSDLEKTCQSLITLLNALVNEKKS